MNITGIIFIFALFLCEINCQGGHIPCPLSFIDRYCGLRDRDTPIKCYRNGGPDRGFEIFENCYNSVHDYGKTLSLDEKLERVCNLDRYEYWGVSNCLMYGIKLDSRRKGKIFNVGDYCLYQSELKENKACGYRPFQSNLGSFVSYDYK